MHRMLCVFVCESICVFASVCVHAPDVVDVAHGHDDIGHVEVGLVRLRPRLHPIHTENERGRGGREGRGRREGGREGRERD